MKWIWTILGLLYLLSPYDLIPGFSPIGWLDDIVVMWLLYRYLSKFNRIRQMGASQFGRRPRFADDRAGEQSKSEPPPRTAYETLGLLPTATHEEIKSAYRQLVSRYHPDKVTHLGAEFQELAAKRFKEIQEAYRQLVR